MTISVRPGRKFLATTTGSTAPEILLKGSGTDFDPQVIAAFPEALKAGSMEIAAVQI